MSSYWKCSVALSKQIAVLETEETRAIAEMKALAKEVGAKRYAAFRSWGGLIIQGFYFDSPPSDKGFYFDRRLKCWVPRAGTPTRKKMAAIRSAFVPLLCKMIGFEQFSGLSFVIPGINLHNKVYYLSLSDDAKPKHAGVKRISDLAYRDLSKRKKKAS